MADITESKNFSSILIKKKIHMVFGTLDDVSDEEKIRIALTEFKRFHELSNDYNQKIVLSWREAQENDWCFSDDLRIVQVLVRNNNGPRTDTTSSYNKGYIRTCVGVFPINPATFMDTRFDLHPNRYSIGQTKKDFTERLKDRETLTIKEELFCSYVANGMERTKAYMQAYETNNIGYALMSSGRLLQQERIQSSISDEVEEILSEQGVSKSYIVQKYKELIDEGLMDLKNCSSSVRAALRDVAEIANMFPSKDKITKQEFRSGLNDIPEDRLLAIKQKKAQLHGLNPSMEIKNESNIIRQEIPRKILQSDKEDAFLDGDGYNELLV